MRPLPLMADRLQLFEFRQLRVILGQIVPSRRCPVYPRYGFKEQLRRTRSMAIDMETATIFAAGFANHIPTGALLLVSDQPTIPEGVKTEAYQTIAGFLLQEFGTIPNVGEHV